MKNETLKFGWVKEGLVVEKKLTGRRYQVVSVDDTKATIRKVEVDTHALTGEINLEILGEEEEVITETNALAFRYCFNPIPRDIVDTSKYAILDGILVDGTSTPITDQGQLQFDRILYSIRGKIILLSKADSDGICSVMSYDIERDIFSDLFTVSKSITKVAETSSYAIFSFYDEHTVDSIDENGDKTTNRICDHSGLVKIGLNGSNEIIHTGGRVKAYIVSNCLVVESSEYIDCDTGYVKPMDHTISEIYIPDEFGDILLYDNSLEVDFGNISSINGTLRNWSVVSSDDRCTVNGKEYSKAVAKAIGDKLFIGRETDGDTTTISFANEANEVMLVTKKNTPDRGVIETVSV